MIYALVSTHGLGQIVTSLVYGNGAGQWPCICNTMYSTPLCGCQGDPQVVAATCYQQRSILRLVWAGRGQQLRETATKSELSTHCSVVGGRCRSYQTQQLPRPTLVKSGAALTKLDNNGAIEIRRALDIMGTCRCVCPCCVCVPAVCVCAWSIRGCSEAIELSCAPIHLHIHYTTRGHHQLARAHLCTRVY